jgi:hypothetical protein
VSPLELAAFEDDDVREVAVKITRAGDGLSEALKVSPVALHRGDEVFYVLRGRVAKITFEEVKPGSDDLRRVHVIVTQDIVEVDGADVSAILKHAQDVIRRKLEEASGQVPLTDPSGVTPFEDLTDAEQALYIAHGSGGHAGGPVEGCPRCVAPPVREPTKRAPGRPRGSKSAAK